MAHQSRRGFIRKIVVSSLVGSLGLASAFGKVQKLPFRLHKRTNDQWLQVKDAFSLAKSRNYFNTAGLGASPRIVVDSVYQAMQKAESLSETQHYLVAAIREKVAKFFNTTADQLAFTRNTTEGMNIIAQSLFLKKGDEILISTHEHVGGAMPWLSLKEKLGLRIKLVELDLSGKDNFERIKQAISRRTKALVISHVTCTTGLILPIKKLVALCKEHQIYSCIDGAQAAGMIQVDLAALDADFYAMSGHKWLYGPKETGLLFINKRILSQLKPTYTGAYSIDTFNLEQQEFHYVEEASRVEYGTRNIPILLGVAVAFDFLTEVGMKKVEEHLKSLANYLKSELSKIDRVEVISPKEAEYASAIVSFRISGIDYLKVRDLLSRTYKCRLRGIYENELYALRASCALYNTFEELDVLIDGVKAIASE